MSYTGNNIKLDRQQKNALDVMLAGKKNVFVTGKAGTGNYRKFLLMERNL